MGKILIKISIAYLLFGTCLGMYMNITKKFFLRPVLNHIHLLGWAVTGVLGLVYMLIPNLDQSSLAKWNTWLHNLGTLIIVASLGISLLNGFEKFMIGVTIGVIIVLIALIFFVINIIKYFFSVI